MRSTLLLVPLACLAGCMSNTDRSAAPAPAKTQAATVAAPGVPAPVVAAPTAAPTPVPAAAAAQPAAKPVTLELTTFSAPTENADLFGYDEGNGRLFYYAGGAVVLPLTVAVAGDYEIAITAACDEADGKKAEFSVALDEQALGGTVTCTTTDSKEYVVKAPGLKAGKHKLAIAFLNDIYKEGEYDLNFYVHGVTLRPAK